MKCCPDAGQNVRHLVWERNLFIEHTNIHTSTQTQTHTEKPWPHLAPLANAVAEAGFLLLPRLGVCVCVCCIVFFLCVSVCDFHCCFCKAARDLTVTSARSTRTFSFKRVTLMFCLCHCCYVGMYKCKINCLSLRLRLNNIHNLGM